MQSGNDIASVCFRWMNRGLASRCWQDYQFMSNQPFGYFQRHSRSLPDTIAQSMTPCS